VPATILPIHGVRQGEFVVIEAALPGGPARPVGVMLVDPSADRAWVRLRPRFDDLTGDTEVLDYLEGDLRDKAAETGAASLLAWLEDTASNVIRISGRTAVEVDAFTRVLEKLYAEHVEAPEVRQFVTHVPLYSLKAAAGSLGEEMAVEAEDWVPVPDGMRISPEHFVAHVVGRSMEPRIPDGSLNLFKLHPAGSRHGKIVLIERFGIADETARYTIKRYISAKKELSEDEWHHERIRLEPLNPEFEPWDVEPQDFAVVAEWLRVIE
jgi:SOS-response transcriptional repressor LexA